jgi:hypothetical protein
LIVGRGAGGEGRRREQQRRCEAQPGDASRAEATDVMAVWQGDLLGRD